MMELFTIFISFFRIGLFAIGGAYSFLPLLEKELVNKYHWLTKSEFLDVFGMVKIFPGAISIKYATYTGYKLAGVPGLIVANVATLLPPIAFVLFASHIYYQYRGILAVQKAFDMVQLAAFAMIMAVAFQLVDIYQLVNVKNLVFVVGFFVLFMYGVHPAFIVLGAGALGAFLK